MRILPVLDLRGGEVVRGIAGRRHEYRPIQSQLTPSSRPVEVARVFRDQWGLRELYLADLDAIAGAAPAFGIYGELQSLGCRLWVDAGLRTAADARALADAGIHCIVAGLETCASPAAVREMCDAHGPQCIAFSLDLRAGEPLREEPLWGMGAESIAARAVEAGARRIIVLDLARVGMGAGTGTEDLCRRLVERFPQVEMVAGGGVRSAADLTVLAASGVQAVLVASALHDGRLRKSDIKAYLNS